MKDRHIWSDGLDVRIAQPDEVIPKPVAFRCEMKARVSKADRFEEFQDPCEGVLVTPKSGGGALVFISTDVMVCTVSLGWSYDNQSNTFVLRPGESITVQGVDRWRCITKGNKGSQCTEKGGFEPLADSVLAEGNKFIVNVLGAPPNDPGNYVNLSTPKSRQPQATTDLSDVPNVVLIVVFSILTVVIIAILVRIVVWAVRRRRAGGPQRIP
jgi:hypothetical protein